MTTPSRYRKKPVEIDAIQMTGGNTVAVVTFIGEAGGRYRTVTHPTDATQDEVYIQTLEGEMRAVDGDWIIRGVQGELYPCKPAIFAATYEPVPATPGGAE
jgi:hypothetical protein